MDTMLTSTNTLSCHWPLGNTQQQYRQWLAAGQTEQCNPPQPVIPDPASECVAETVLRTTSMRGTIPSSVGALTSLSVLLSA